MAWRCWDEQDDVAGATSVIDDLRKRGARETWRRRPLERMRPSGAKKMMSFSFSTTAESDGCGRGAVKEDETLVQEDGDGGMTFGT